MKRPAPINLKGLKKVALGTFKGKNSRHVNLLMNQVTQNLLETQYFDSVLDRQNLDDIIKEHKLKLSGLVNDDGIMELGNFIGAAALIFGEIETDAYQEDITKRNVVITNKVDSGKKDEYKRTIYKYTYEDKIQHTRTGIYKLTISFQMVDVETARLITVKTMPVSRKVETKSYEGKPDPIDPETIYLQLASQVSSEFVRQLVPSYVSVQARFEKDKELPQVELAIQKMQAGFNDDAIALFEEMTRNTALKLPIQAKTWYNLGLAQGFNQQFEESLINIKKAMDMNPKNKLYMQSLNMIRNEQKNAEILKSQE